MKSLVYQTPLAQLLINLLITVLETAGALERLVLNETNIGNIIGYTNITRFFLTI